MIGSIVGFTCYWLAPAIGPKVYFAGRFPLLHATQSYLDHLPLYDFNPHHPRNDMPSCTSHGRSWHSCSPAAFPSSDGFTPPCSSSSPSAPPSGSANTISPIYRRNLARAHGSRLDGGAPLVARSRSLRAVVIGFAMLSAWIAAIHFEAPIRRAPHAAAFLGTVAAAIVFERALARAETRTGAASAGAAAPSTEAVSRSARRQRRKCSDASALAEARADACVSGRGPLFRLRDLGNRGFLGGGGGERSFFRGLPWAALPVAPAFAADMSSPASKRRRACAGHRPGTQHLHQFPR